MAKIGKNKRDYDLADCYTPKQFKKKQKSKKKIVRTQKPQS